MNALNTRDTETAENKQQKQENAENKLQKQQNDTPYWDIGRLIVSLVLCILVVVAVAALDKCG